MCREGFLTNAGVDYRIMQVMGWKKPRWVRKERKGRRLAGIKKATGQVKSRHEMWLESGLNESTKNASEREEAHQEQ